MAENASIFRSVQWGAESVPGTAVAADKRLLVVGAQPLPQIPGEEIQLAGHVFPSGTIVRKERSEGPIEGRWSFTDLTYLFNSILVKVTPSTPSGATNTRLWNFLPSDTQADVFQTYTIETGGAVSAERMVYAFVNTLTMRATEEESSVTGTLVGKKLTPGITITPTPTVIPARIVNPISIAGFLGTALTSEVQTIALGSPSAGNWTITARNPWRAGTVTTGNIVYNAAASAVTTALEAIYGHGNVAASGSAGGPYTITWQGAHTSVNISPLTVDGAGLTGGSVNVTQTTAGALTKMLRFHEFEFGMDGRQTIQDTLDPEEESWTYSVARRPDLTCRIVIQHDALSQTIISHLKASTTNYLKIVAEGPTIEGNFRNLLELTFPVKFRELAVADRNDVQAATYEASMTYDDTFGGAMRARLWNDIAAL
jgi:hypothetical protein